MTTTQRPFRAFLLVACLATAAGSVLYSAFGRPDATVHAQESSAGLVGSSGVAFDAGADRSRGGKPNLAALSPRAARDSRRAAVDVATQVAIENHIREIRQRKADTTGNPAGIAAAMDRLIASEPSLPPIEQANAHAVQIAMRQIPSNSVSTSPVGLETSCRGRRCVVSAGFGSDLAASEWAHALLLSGAKGLPQAARIVILPLQSGGAVNLQLYLY